MNDDAHLQRVTHDVRILASILARMAQMSFEQQLQDLNFGVSPMQYGVMRSLCRDQHTISELSRKFAVDPSTLVPVVDALERKGLVLRERDPQDRRRVPLALTDAGEALLQQATPLGHDDAFYKALADMGAERAQLLRSLLKEAIGAMPEGETILQQVLSRLDAAAADETMRGPKPSQHAQGHGHEQNHLKNHDQTVSKGKG